MKRFVGGTQQDPKDRGNQILSSTIEYLRFHNASEQEWEIAMQALCSMLWKTHTSREVQKAFSENR